MRCAKHAGRFINGDNIRQSYRTWWFDQLDMTPGFVEYVLVEEFQTIQVQLDGTPGQPLLETEEVIDQLLLGEIVDFIVEKLANATNGPCVRVDGLGL